MQINRRGAMYFSSITTKVWMELTDEKEIKKYISFINDIIELRVVLITVRHLIPLY